MWARKYHSVLSCTLKDASTALHILILEISSFEAQNVKGKKPISRFCRKMVSLRLILMESEIGWI